MGFFDKLFGTEDKPDFGQLGGKIISHHELDITLRDIEKVDVGVLKFRDPAKEIKMEVWDALTESARNELKSKGYYCEGDNTDEHIVVIEP